MYSINPNSEFDIKKQLKKQGVALIARDGSGNVIGFKDMDGVAVSGSAPSYAWASKPTAVGNKNKYIIITDLIETNGEAVLFQSDGTVWQQRTIPRTTFAKAFASTNLKGTAGLRVICIDIGLGGGIELVSNGTYLKPISPVLLFSEIYGTVAAPALTLSAAGSYTLPNVPTFPANLFYGVASGGSALQVISRNIRTGTAGTLSHTLYLGTAGNNTDSAIVSAAAATTAANGHLTNAPNVTFISPSAIISSGTSIAGGNGSAAPYLDKSTKINTAAPMFISAYANPLNTPTQDTASLLSLEVWWKA